VKKAAVSREKVKKVNAGRKTGKHVLTNGEVSKEKKRGHRPQTVERFQGAGKEPRQEGGRMIWFHLKRRNGG